MKSTNADRDLQLLARLKKGDHFAFEEIYKEYAAGLVSFASSKLYSLEVARDLIHDVFVYLWANRETIEVNKALHSYLYSATRNKIIDHIRKCMVREHFVSGIKDASSAIAENPESTLEAKDLNSYLNTVVESFSPRLKTIYKLSRNEHRNISEIAKMLNLSEQTVKNQLSIALKFLKNSMTKLSLLLILLLTK